MMKRKFAFIMPLCLIFVFLLSACKKGDDDLADNAKDNINSESSDIPTGERLDAIIYEGNKYCGLAMTWELETLPEGFANIGEFSGALTEEEEELTSTMIFKIGEKVYHYEDESGYHYFCVKHKTADTYIGIYQAEIFTDEIELNKAREIADY